MNFHVFLAQDNLLSLQGKTGIVGDDEYASWEFRTMVSFILMSLSSYWEIPNMMSWVIFVNFYV